jgi:hypothetical protein
MLLEQTRSYIVALSDADLLRYVRTGVEEYEPDAVTFAQQEFERRNLDATRITELTTIVADQRRGESIAATELATAPLSRKGRVFAYIAGLFLFGMPFLFVLSITAQYKNRGEMNKADEVCSYFILGLLTIAGLAMVSILTVFVVQHL